MYLRLYKFKKKHVRKDGTVTIGPNRQWKWIKNAVPYRKQTRGKPKTMLSKRFGYLENYSRKEQQMLKCPSGYSVSQGMNALRKLWRAYFGELNIANVAGMQKRARAIQEVQEDMGLKTTSFPHLGIYGDVLVFRDYKSGEYGEEIDHSELKEKQDLEEQKEKFAEIAPLIEADLQQAEQAEIVTIADEIPQPRYRPRIKHSNRMHFGKKQKEEWICENCDETVPANKNHICNHKEEENLLIFTDDIPFESFQEN